MTTVDWTREATDQLGQHLNAHLRPRLDGLTDDEYLWEPVPGAWSLHRRGAARTAMAGGAGDLVADLAYPAPEPAPVTTIAWRMAHIAVGCLGMPASNHFGDGSVSYETTHWSLDAAGGLALLDRHDEAWMAGLTTLGPGGMARACGPAEGPFADHPIGALVLHINREVIHSGAEIALLRDLYAHRAR